MRFGFFLIFLFLAETSVGIGPSKIELSKAAKGFLESAKGGDAYSQHMISQAYWNGWGVKKNDKISLRWLNKSVDQNFPPALADLGNRMLLGAGVKKDEEAGLRLLKKAAAQNDTVALNNLGSYYIGFLSPKGTVIDSKLAKEYLISSSKLGDTYAMLYLGQMYQYGREPEASPVDDINVQKTEYWYERSAKGLNIHAIASLGLFYWDPAFQNVDYRKAYFWLKIAKLMGANEWSSAFHETELRLNKSSRLKMDYEADEWLKTHSKTLQDDR